MNWGQRERKPMVGAVIVFREGTTEENAQRYLTEMYKRGILAEPSKAHEYDSNFSGPVWYLP